MRIIAGEFRSRRLLTPRDASVTRPMPDRVRESLFGLLRGHVEDARVVDLFAGTGSIGLEAISRGAARCVFVEKDRQVARLLQRNIDALGVADRCEVVIGDALGPGALARCPRPTDLAFMDPPYPLARDPLGWKRIRAQFERLIDLLADDGFAILRTPWPHVLVPAGAAEPDGDGPARRRRQHHREHERGRARYAAEPAPEDLELEADDLPSREVGAAAPPPPREPADLAFANAEGPETHVYHAMAVHLYMRRK